MCIIKKLSLLVLAVLLCFSTLVYAKKLPKVDILYTYSNYGSKITAEAFLNASVKGLVVAGSINENQLGYLRELVKSSCGSSRTGYGYVPNANDGMLNTNNLKHKKTRILLMLALTKTKNHKKIQAIFDKY